MTDLNLYLGFLSPHSDRQKVQAYLPNVFPKVASANVEVLELKVIGEFEQKASVVDGPGFATVLAIVKLATGFAVTLITK